MMAMLTNAANDDEKTRDRKRIKVMTEKIKNDKIITELNQEAKEGHECLGVVRHILRTTMLNSL